MELNKFVIYLILVVLSILLIGLGINIASHGTLNLVIGIVLILLGACAFTVGLTNQRSFAINYVGRNAVFAMFDIETHTWGSKWDTMRRGFYIELLRHRIDIRMGNRWD